MALSTTHRAAVEAIAAGHDLAIVSKEYEKIKASRDALAKAIDDSHIPPNRLKEASSRLKKTLRQVALCK
jgi:hypothetical protein